MLVPTSHWAYGLSGTGTTTEAMSSCGQTPSVSTPPTTANVLIRSPSWGDIYSNADVVFIWLGREAQNSDMAIGFLKILARHRRDYEAGRARVLAMAEDPRCLSQWRALSALMRRRWFERASKKPSWPEKPPAAAGGPRCATPTCSTALRPCGMPGTGSGTPSVGKTASSCTCLRGNS